MAVDFPSSPVVGQTFVVGLFTYTWDGTQWTGKFTGPTKVLIKKTPTPNNPPADNSLLPGELAVEMGGPWRLWVGVPTAIIPTGKKLLLDTATAIDKYVDIAGDTMTGPLQLPAAMPVAPTEAANKAYVDSLGTAAANSVRYDVAQALTVPQKVQARQNIYAAPFDAMAFNGMQVNGAMDVSQEYAGTLKIMTTSESRYLCDAWQTTFSGPAGTQMRSQQLGTSIGTNGATLMRAFANSLHFWAGTPALTPLASNHYALYQHYVEGSRVQRLGFGGVNAQPMTVAFWAFTTIPGTATLIIRNGPGDRCYVTTFTMNAANTWEYKVITIPGDTIGNWTGGNSTGLVAILSFACGTAFQTAVTNAWQTGNFFGTAASTNFFTVAGNAAVVTGFMLLPGSEAPSAERSALIQRPFDAEIQLAQRYWEKSYDYGQVPGTATAAGAEVIFIGSGLTSLVHQAGASIRFKVQKRNVPTITVRATITGNSGFVSNGLSNADLPATVDNQASSGARVYSTAEAAAGQIIRYWHWVADSRLT